MKEPVAAIRFCEKAVAILPPFPEAHSNLASAAREALDIPKGVLACPAAVRYSQVNGVTSIMREGEPFIPDAIKSVEYYAERVRDAAHAKSPDPAAENSALWM